MNFTCGTHNFLIGCNYWASHAGIRMWSDWRPEVVERDFAALQKLHLGLVRVFPLWSVFQPLIRCAGCANQSRELRWRDGSELPYDEDGRQSGVDAEMLQRFRFVCDCAQKNGLSVGVGLITGWMSGELFAPPAFEHSNLLRDPLVIRWQMKFVERFVTEFRDHPAIAFWGPGNECNCLDQANRHSGAMWTKAITETIRAADSSRPILAGMHGLSTQSTASLNDTAAWSIADMAEDFDVLTVHPYPLFSGHTAVDRLTGFKNVFHAAAEAHFYGDIGRRPCIAEEVGTLAPSIANDRSAAVYLRNSLLQLWAHDCEGLLWWCGFEQMHLTQPPYQWFANERMLGLFHADGSLKPVAEEMRNFAEMRKALPFKNLPQFQKDAVCILTPDQDCWMAAYGSWCLAKQAGFDLEFQHSDEPLRDSDFYLLPAIAGLGNITRDRYLDLEQRVRAGATLFCSFDGACLAPFEEFFGMSVNAQENYSGHTSVELAGESLSFDFRSRLQMKSVGAEILCRDREGNPVLSCYRLGKGVVYFMAYSPERQVVLQNRAIEENYSGFYRVCAERILQNRILRTENRFVTVTLHKMDERHVIALLINNGDENVTVEPLVKDNWRIERIVHGEYPSIAAHNSAILMLTATINEKNVR